MTLLILALCYSTTHRAGNFLRRCVPHAGRIAPVDEGNFVCSWDSLRKAEWIFHARSRYLHAFTRPLCLLLVRPPYPLPRASLSRPRSSTLLKAVRWTAIRQVIWFEGKAARRFCWRHELYLAGQRHGHETESLGNVSSDRLSRFPARSAGVFSDRSRSEMCSHEHDGCDDDGRDPPRADHTVICEWSP
jgi:hypothetical protein